MERTCRRKMQNSLGQILQFFKRNGEKREAKRALIGSRKIGKGRKWGRGEWGEKKCPLNLSKRCNIKTNQNNRFSCMKSDWPWHYIIDDRSKASFTFMYRAVSGFLQLESQVTE